MLKSLVALLLSKFVKRSDTAHMAHQAAPDGWSRRVLLKDNVKGSFEGQYTAPTDGYMCLDAGNGLTSVTLSGSIHFRMQTASSNLVWPQIFIPLSKGHVCNYVVSAVDSSGDGSNLYFVPFIGATF